MASTPAWALSPDKELARLADGACELLQKSPWLLAGKSGQVLLSHGLGSADQVKGQPLQASVCTLEALP